LPEEKDVKLYWSPRSPYVKLVLVTAHEVGLSDDIRHEHTIVDIERPLPGLIGHNPLCKIPTLVLDDGTSIFDSRVICEYLDERQGRRLLPAEGPDRLVQLRRQALGIGLIDLLLSWLLERNRPAEKQQPAVLSAIRVKCDHTLDALEAIAPDLGNSYFRMGHVAIGVALSYLDFRFATIDWRAGRQELAAWHSIFENRTSYQANPFFDEIAAAKAAVEGKTNVSS
jgi:glutathione S-transferase